MNRCSGLRFAQNLLRQTALTREESDFVGRNLAKAQLALGDVVLTAAGLRRLPQELQTEATTWTDLVSAYRNLWRSYN